MSLGYEKRRLNRCAAIWWPCYGQPMQSNAINCAKFRSRSHDAVIRVYDGAGNVIETLEQAVASSGDFWFHR
jgi:hypothetical protein